MPEEEKKSKPVILIVLALIGALGGGSGVWAVLDSHLAAGREQSSEQSQSDAAAAKYWRNETRVLQDKVAALSLQVAHLSQELAEYKLTQIDRDAKDIIEQMFQASHRPMWLHEVGKNRWYVNRAYCERWGIPKREFWDPINVLAQYPAPSASAYVSNDMAVLQANSPMAFKERVPERVLFPESADNPSEYYWITKHPLSVLSRSYVWGQAYQEEPITYLEYIKGEGILP